LGGPAGSEYSLCAGGGGEVYSWLEPATEWPWGGDITASGPSLSYTEASGSDDD
jgi:hypothetical protein